MSTPRVLLLGGHGKISLLLTPKIVARSWNLTSVIRNPKQKDTILEAGKNGPGTVDVLVASLENVKSDADAQRILDQIKPDYVVFSAGGGGEDERTITVDRNAAIHFINSSISTSSVKKFLLVSALSIRRGKAPWWDEKGYKAVQKVNTEVMPMYYQTKLAADEALTVAGEKRMAEDESFSYIILRPGFLVDNEETGRVSLGRTIPTGEVGRADVAEVAARLLEKEGARGWIDLMDGDEEIGEAIERVVNEKIDCVEGEDIGLMKENLAWEV